MRALYKVGGTEVKNSAIGVVKGSIFHSRARNRFGHDISKPHEEPHIMYYPPPEDWFSRLAYAALWAARAARRALGL